MTTKTNFLKASDVATKLNLSESTIRSYVFKKQIPHVKLRGALLFEENEIDKWIESKKVDAIE